MKLSVHWHTPLTAEVACFDFLRAFTLIILSDGGLPIVDCFVWQALNAEFRQPCDFAQVTMLNFQPASSYNL
jgi:hypothetical protein